jgi:hypothetical protein
MELWWQNAPATVPRKQVDMAFGKRTGSGEQNSVKPAPAPPAGKQSNTLRNVLIGVAIFLALSYLSRQATFLIGRHIESSADLAMQEMSNSSLGDFVLHADEILQQEGDKVEIAVHRKCAAPQVAALAKLSSNSEFGKEWARHGYEERVVRVSNYVSCIIADTPSRFCKPVARQRLVMAIHGYLDIQAHVLLKAKEQAEMDMGIMPAPLGEGVSDVSLLRLDPILLQIDGRIEAGISRLISSGIVSPEDFSRGFFSSPHEGLARIISQTPAGKPSCA